VGSVDINDTTPTEDQLLTAANNFTDASGLVGVVFSYQWQQSAVGGGAVFTNIAGATAVSFTPGQAQVGRNLQVVVSYTDNSGNAETITSAPTALVANLNDAPIGTVTISDTTPQENQLLTATTAFTDEDGLVGTVFSYQWEQSAVGGGAVFTPIAGATAATFTPLAAQANRQLRVVATYTDNQGTLETVTSAATATTTALADIGLVFNGGAGADVFNGGNGNDTANGNGGTDTLNGNGGNDTFEFAAGFGNDTITGFDAAGGSIANQDLMDIRPLGITAATFAGWVTITDLGNDTLVTIDDTNGAGGVVQGTILLLGVVGQEPNAISVTDFILA
jgi:hypothetical protein